MSKRATTMMLAGCLVATGAFADARRSPSPPNPPSAPTPDQAAPDPALSKSDIGSATSGAPPEGVPLVSGRPAVPNPVLARINGATLKDDGIRDGVDPAVLRAQVMLDRVHASPGVIDGRDGANFQHALEIYEKAKGLKISKSLDEDVWTALLKEAGAPVLKEYVLTADDVAGPFFPDLPKDYSKLAEMKTMGYHDVLQKIGAKFHMGEELVGALNPGIDLGKAGSRIVVADLEEKPVHGKLARIFVDKRKSQVLGYDRKGHVLVAYPATIGSRELPSPSGTYRVKGVAWNPIYYYNPKNFIQGDNKQKLQLPPGPNNPVGTVFIALTKPTYGLHGTPDPSKIDKTASHGCVRMTNWDATELAHLVRPGVKVSFGRSH